MTLLVLPGLLAMQAVAQQTAISERAIDFIPPAWTQFNIQWKPTWEETLAANKPEDWQKEVSQDKALAQAVNQIVALRKIELLRAMVQRFPSLGDKRAEAYRTIAETYGQVGMKWWSSYYGWKLSREFPDRKDLLPEAYAAMLTWQFGSTSEPDARDWEFALKEAMALDASGVIPPTHRAFPAPCFGMLNLTTQERRYEEFIPELKAFAKLGAGSAIVNSAAARLLCFFGHIGPAFEFDAKAGPNIPRQAQGDPSTSPLGTLGHLPRNPDLETRWEALVGSLKVRDRDEVGPEDVQALLDLTLRVEGLLVKSPSHTVSFRAAAEQWLGKLSPDRMVLVREAQDKAVRNLAEELRRTGDWEYLMTLSRRFPWARSLHEVLLDLGEQALRDGERQWASAAFHDVLHKAGEEELRNQARVGLWLVTVQAVGNRSALEAAMAAVPDDAQVTWRGGRRPVGEVKREILSQPAVAEEGKAVKLSELPRRSLELPANWPAEERHADGPVGDFGLHAPWPICQVQPVGDALFVSAPGRIARFGPKGGAPEWVFAPPGKPEVAGPPALLPEAGRWDVLAAGRYAAEYRASPGFDRRPIITRSPAAPAVSVDGKTIYCLLAGQGSSAAVGQVAALDAATGKLLWSTEGRPEWKDLSPVSRPACAGGRVYVLAVPAGLGANAGAGPGRDLPQAGRGPAVPWQLVCLDGQDSSAMGGQIVWKSAIGGQAFTLLDLARVSGPVTIYQGAVYCTTNMGVVARCDVRDGAVDWVRGYASAATTEPNSGNFSREGSALGWGDMLLVAPRDHSGVLAFHCRTGESLWEAIMVPSDRIVGVAGGTLVAMNERYLAGLSLKDGQPLWYRKFPVGTGSQAALVGSEVVVASDGRLERLTCAMGKTVEQLDPPGPARLAAETVFLPDGSLVEVQAPRMAGQGAVARSQSVPLGFPLEEVWTLPCNNPELILPKDAPSGTSGAGAFCVLSGRRLGYVKTQPAMELTWQSVVHSPPWRAAVLGNQLVLAAGQDVSALDLSSGTRRWSLNLPFLPYSLSDEKGLVLAIGNPQASPCLAVIDSSAGKLLSVRSLADGARFQGGLLGQDGATLTSDPDGSSTLHAVMTAMFGDEGWRPAEVRMDARTGRIQDIRRILSPGGVMVRVACEGGMIRYIGEDGRLHVEPFGSDPQGGRPGGGGRDAGLRRDQAAAWERRIDLNAAGRYPPSFGHHASAEGYYIRHYDQLFHFDKASGKEVVYQLPPGTQPGQCVIFDFRRSGDQLVVVSGMTGEPPRTRGRHGWISDPYDIARSRMYVDIFDRASGRHICRQELAGLPCCQPHLTGYTTQAKVLDDPSGAGTIVVTDPDGVHFFRPHAAGAKAYGEAVAALRAFGERVAGGVSDVTVFGAAAARADAAARGFERAINQPGAEARIPLSERQAMVKRLQDGIQAIRAQALQPVLMPPAGGFIDTMNTLTVSTAIQGTEIRYTLDGSDPVTQGAVYAQPIPLTGPLTIKAVADLPGQVKPTSPSVQGTYHKVPARAADLPLETAGLQPGVQFHYAQGSVRTVADALALKVIKTGVARTFSINPWLGTHMFAVTYTGYIRVPADGVYTFYTTSDDGTQLYIGGTLVVNNDLHHPPQTRGGEIGLRGGYHAIKLCYFEEVGDEMLKVEYERPGLARQEIPASVLFHRP